jgi:hypothetical protein
MSVCREYFRPWKLLTLSAGVGLLVLGACLLDFPDWDIPVSIIMASMAYVFAPWTACVLLQRQWRLAPWALMAAWATVDGSYWLYWRTVNPEALFMRPFQWPLSLFLFAMCGALWCYQGAFREMVDARRSWLVKHSRAFRM